MKAMSAVLALVLALACVLCAQAAPSGGDEQRQNVYDALSDAIYAAEIASHGLVHLSKQPSFRSSEVESLLTCASLVDQSKEELNRARDESNRLFQGDGKDQTRKDEIGLAASTASIVYRTCQTNLRDVRARQVVIERVDQVMMPFVHSALTAVNLVSHLKV